MMHRFLLDISTIDEFEFDSFSLVKSVHTPLSRFHKLLVVINSHLEPSKLGRFRSFGPELWPELWGPLSRI